MFAQALVVGAAMRSSRGQKIRKALVRIGSAMALVLVASSAAQAQCAFTPPGLLTPLGHRVFTFVGSTATAMSAAVTTMNTAFQTQTSAFIASPPGTQTNQLAGGVWIRGVGGRADITSNTDGTIGTTVVPALGSFSCTVRSRNEFTGVQGGIDLGSLNLGGSGWNIHGGVTAGYLESESRTQAGGSARSEVPFIGIYAALTGAGGFFLDAQVRRDFYQINVVEPSMGLPGTSINASGWGITASAGYNWSIGNFFVEPSVGIAYSRTSIDPLSFTAIAPPPAVPIPGVISLSDIETILGRVGVRVGTSMVTGRVALQPFAAVSVFHEFSGATTGDFTTAFAAPPQVIASFNSSRVGTFGQYSLGFAANVLDTGWLGYARVDYRSGDNIEGFSVNGGLRYQFAPSHPTAVAQAPMATKAPVVASAQTWAGFYIGGYVGGTWSDNVTVTELGSPAGGGYNAIGDTWSYGLGSSMIGGLTVGYNHQMGTIVVGAEAEGGYLRLSGSASSPLSVDTVSKTEVGDWYALLAARLGFSVGPALIYAKGGAALLSVKSTLIDSCFAGGCGGATVAASGGNSVGLTWAGGGGLEVALGANWSVKGEYLYLAASDSYIVSGPGFAGAGFPRIFQWNHDVPGVHTAKLGLNYRFGG